MRRTLQPLLVGLAMLPSLVLADEPGPKPAEGWSIELIARAPDILFPTAVVVAPDGTIYLGQDPMDMPGPASKPIDSVVALQGGKVRTFADGLHAVMGLEWIDDTLYVVHAPFLSTFTDTNGDGRSDRRVDLMTGLGPPNPAFSGINDHIASGMRLGIDGFLYIAVGDKGIPKGVGKDGATIRMKGGGVIRIRPDGTDLEIVSTGERNPLSVALTDRDEIFTYGNDDDGKRWPNSLTHHIVGGHYGYPYEFLTAPWRCLPIVQGQFGGGGAQAIVYNEDGLPYRYDGNLFICDWGLSTVFRYELAKAGSTFKVVKREPLVAKGMLPDFRPFSIAVAADRSSLILVDWAYNGWLADGPKTGRLYRLRYVGSDKVMPGRPASSCGFLEPNGYLSDLRHPALSVRLAAQRTLARRFRSVESTIAAEINRRSDPRVEGDRFEWSRVHAIWTLDAINTPTARASIRESLVHASNAVRREAARSSGIRRDRPAAPAIAKLLRDFDPDVRREAAIALGRIGDVASAPALLAALGDPDRFVAWSVRSAIRRLGAWDAPAIEAALRDPKRRDDTLALVDESWAAPAITALTRAFAAEADPLARARMVANLAAQYRKYPEWSGAWFGTNPVAGAFPAKTVDWDPEAMADVRQGIARGLSDPEARVRRQAILGLAEIGPEAAPDLLAALPLEAEANNRLPLIATLGRWGEPRAVPILGRFLAAADQPLAVRIAALDALGGINQRAAFNLRFAVLFDPKAPPELVARALPALGRSGALPPNDLADFLDGKPKAVQVAALEALRGVAKLPPDVHARIIARLDDPDLDVRRTTIDAVARLRLPGAVPKLLELAKADATRADASLALAMIPDPRALGVYLAALEDRSPDLRRAASEALLRIRPQVSAELTRRARAGGFTGPSAEAVERVLANFRPVVAWRVIGPFARTTGPLFFGEPSIDFARVQSGAGGRHVGWGLHPADPKTGRVVLDDFKAVQGNVGGSGYDTNGSPDLAAFAQAEVASDRERDALLLVGSSGSIAITLNEKAVLNTNVAGRPFAPDSDIVRVRLVKGTNRLLVRSRQGTGAWTFSVALSEPSEPIFAAKPEGRGIEGLRAFALNHSGDARKGEELFFDARGLNCAKCHTADGRGNSAVGPNLTGLALKYDKAEIIRSVLEPSTRIATGYQPAVVARKDGTVVSGLVLAETDAFVELVDAEVRPMKIAKADIEDRRIGDVSVMPAGQVDGLAPVDFADLVAYLLSLKSPPMPH